MASGSSGTSATGSSSAALGSGLREDAQDFKEDCDVEKAGEAGKQRGSKHKDWSLTGSPCPRIDLDGPEASTGLEEPVPAEGVQEVEKALAEEMVSGSDKECETTRVVSAEPDKEMRQAMELECAKFAAVDHGRGARQAT